MCGVGAAPSHRCGARPEDADKPQHEQRRQRRGEAEGKQGEQGAKEQHSKRQHNTGTALGSLAGSFACVRAFARLSLHSIVVGTAPLCERCFSQYSVGAFLYTAFVVHICRDRGAKAKFFARSAALCLVPVCRVRHSPLPSPSRPPSPMVSHRLKFSPRMGRDGAHRIAMMRSDTRSRNKQEATSRGRVTRRRITMAQTAREAETGTRAGARPRCARVLARRG